MAPAGSNGATPRRRATDTAPTSSARRAAAPISLAPSPRDAQRERERATPRERIGTSRSEPALKPPRDARDPTRAAYAAAYAAAADDDDADDADADADADATPAPPLPPSPARGVLLRHTAADLTAPPLQVSPADVARNPNTNPI
jgi:hypothetical protein